MFQVPTVWGRRILKIRSKWVYQKGLANLNILIWFFFMYSPSTSALLCNLRVDFLSPACQRWDIESIWNSTHIFQSSITNISVGLSSSLDNLYRLGIHNALGSKDIKCGWMPLWSLPSNWRHDTYIQEELSNNSSDRICENMRKCLKWGNPRC